MSEIINSKEYWEKRFAEKDWEINEGREQTSFFYNLLFKMLPQWIISDIINNKMTIADLGCAEGQGTAILSERFGNNVTGTDASPSAIETARKLYKDIRFEVGDLLHMSEIYDVCVISNVLEHFTAPFEIAKNIVKNCRSYMIIMLPFEEEPLMKEHMVSFFYNNIPIAINRMNLVHFSEVDCRVMPNTQFFAKQILLVYSSKIELTESVSIESMSNIIQLYRSSMNEYREQLNKLSQQLFIESQDSAEIDKVSIGLREKLNILRNLIDAGTKLQFLTETESSVAMKQIIEDIQAAYRQSHNNYENLLQLYDKERNIRRVIIEKYNTRNSIIHQKLTKALEENNSLKIAISEKELMLIEEELECNEKKKALLGLKNEYNNLDQQFSHLNTTHLELVARFNSLNDAYGVVVCKNQEILSSRTWRAANKLKTVASKIGLLHFLKYLLAVRNFGLVTATKKAIYKLKASRTGEVIPYEKEMRKNNNICSVDEEMTRTINFRRDSYMQVLSNKIDNDIIKSLNQELSSKKYKGIVIYPHAVHWEPMQRPQHFLREFAQKGYLCFFCETNTWKIPFTEVEKNLYVVNEESLLLPFLQDKHPIVLITYSLQMVFCEFLPQKTIWFDILDRLDFFALSGNLSKEIYNDLSQTADVISYSAKSLLEFTNNRKDAVLLPNAVKTSDFWDENKQQNTDEFLKELVSRKKAIIGYYGAIEKWFDHESIIYLADNLDCEIVLIGHVGIEPSLLKRKNIHLLGAKPYHELQCYSRSFSIGLIPFVVNDLTNAVSPVKFFEYCALGIPTVSSAISEMLPFKGKVVRLYHSPSELVTVCNTLLEGDEQATIRQEAFQIAEQNSWRNRAEQIEKRMFTTVSHLQPLANANHSGMVAVEAVTFFKYNGSSYYSGGAERYLIDLYEVCKEMGIRLRIYQYAEFPWLRFYRDIEVVGMNIKGIDPNFYSTDTIKAMSHYFNKVAGSQASLSIYSPFFILSEKSQSKSIGISHGVSWDDEFCEHDSSSFWATNGFRINACSSCDRMVSVDTNTANWFQTISYNLGRKITYIPNYVDNVEFCPRKKFDSLREQIVITYPRRLYGARGLYVVLEVLDEILRKYPNVEFHFVGKGFDNDTKHVEKKIVKWKGRIQWYSCPPEKMHEVYKNSDISLIPTMYSEGTSLSCLEALSSGNAVIATRIGGLTDIIINGYNGLLIEPNAEALKEAVFTLLDNTELMIQLKRTAVATAQAFSKEHWKEKWKKQIKKLLPDISKALPYQKTKICRITIRDIVLSDIILVSVVKKMLAENWTVFICSKMKLTSFERLQFISLEEDIYFEPSLSLADQDGTLEQYFIENLK